MYGEFKNVILTIDEFKKVSSDEIESLSTYLASTGKKYKSHYATILNWRGKNDGNQTRTNRPNNPALPGTKSTKYSGLGTTIHLGEKESPK